MFRIVRRTLLAITLLLCGFPVWAQSFQGRQVEVFDGRADTTRSAPLVIAMHGFLGTARNMRRKTGLDALARKHGFVVVYPTGKARRWNDGRSVGARVDDVGYLSALIGALVAQGTATRGQVFLTGHSNGGGMAMRMACDRPDLINGIAVIATKSALNYQCPDGAPVPALFIHGTKDPISPHGGRSGDSRLGGALSARATIDLWKMRNRCSNAARSTTIDRRDDGTSATVFDYLGCTVPLTYIQIDGHGHDWPKPGNRATRLQGPASQEIDGSARVWSFFARQL